MTNTGFFAILTQAMKTWSERRETRHALEVMTDRELKDIGLTRGDINAVVEGRFNARNTLWDERNALREEWAVLEAARRTIEAPATIQAINLHGDHRMAA